MRPPVKAKGLRLRSEGGGGWPRSRLISSTIRERSLLVSLSIERDCRAFTIMLNT